MKYFLRQSRNFLFILHIFLNKCITSFCVIFVQNASFTSPVRKFENKWAQKGMKLESKLNWLIPSSRSDIKRDFSLKLTFIK